MNPPDMSRVIAQYQTETELAITRRPAGAYDGTGYYQPGTAVALTIAAHVQPASARDLELVPEGQRNKKIISIYPLLVADKLQTAVPEGDQADLVTYDGDTYEVQHFKDWADSGNYTKAVAVLVDEPS